jgi:hypothetical protein
MKEKNKYESTSLTKNSTNTKPCGVGSKSWLVVFMLVFFGN